MNMTAESTSAQQEELLRKYDSESSFRQLSGKMATLVKWIAIIFSMFHLYTAIFGVFQAQIQRSIHLGFALVLIFLLFPARKGGKGDRVISWYDYLLAIVGIVIGLYWPIGYEGISNRIGEFTMMDYTFGAMAILLVLEAARRVVGLPIVIIASVFLVYAYAGPYLPGFLNHRGASVERIIGHMFFTTEGILGTPIAVSATFIFLFLIFGTFLDKTGVGRYFNDLALVVAGRSIGGPAKVAVFASALHGTISGSSVSNVVTVGSFTIPLMKKLGYRKEFAGAVEASASTGGQIMPPIMGAAAFLMAEFLGVSYWDIAKAAIIPAALYFLGIWIMVHFEAKRLGLRGLSPEELPDKKEVFKKIYLLLPIVAILGFLMTGMTATRAALFGILAVILVGNIRKETRMSFKEIINALESGARTALGVAAATAVAGIIVGVVTLTGLGLKFATGLVDLAQGNIILTLVLTMVASLILGMGVPTTANYIITSTIAAPAIIQLGFPELSAHMFAFYFGIAADITPPVCLAAMAAAGIAKSKPFKTGVEATRLAIAAFLIPYIFVLSPALILIDTTVAETISVIITSIIGMYGISVGLIGFGLRKMNWLERIIALAGGLLLIIPGVVTDLIGLGALLLLFAFQKWGEKRVPKTA